MIFKAHPKKAKKKQARSSNSDQALKTSKQVWKDAIPLPISQLLRFKTPVL